MSTYLVNRSPSSAIGFKTPVDMLGFLVGLLVLSKGCLNQLRNMGFNESGEYKKTFIGSGVGTGSVQVLQEVEFEVEPQEDHTFEVKPHGNLDHVAGSQELQTQDLIYYHLACDRNNTQHINYSAIEKTVMRMLLQLLKQRRFMHMSDLLLIIQLHVSDDSDGYYWEYTLGLLDKANGNVLGMEIVRDRVSFPQQYLCCENCGGPHANFQCQPRNQNFYEPNLFYNSNSSGFDQTPPVIHRSSASEKLQEDFNQQRMNDVHNEWINNYMIESRNELLKTMQSLGEMLREQVANLSTHTPEPLRHFNSICDDDEESTIPLNEIISQLPPSIAITPVLPTMEPEDSLIMGDENLSTIPEKESDEFIKSSVEDLVPIPRESEDTSDSDKECDLPFSMTFSNPLFDANDDFTSSDDESLLEEDVPEENFKIYSNPLFEFDEEYISSDVNPLFNEVLEDILEELNLYVSNLV
ncbi:hypothetical protein Tco_0862806 [Tanacetum coccineum]